MITRGDVVWVDFGVPRGSEPAKVRPAVVFQQDWLTASNINTVLLVPLTSNTAQERFPGNVLIPADISGLDKDSVTLAPQLGPVSREFVDPYPAGSLPGHLVHRIEDGIRLVTGL